MKTDTKKKHWNFSSTDHKAKAFVALIVSLTLTIVLLYYFTDLKKIL